jgi:hypothetical protein
MDKKQSAFPFEQSGNIAKERSQGMTLRDYFASKVIIGVWQASPYSQSELVKRAYEIADLMLKQRQL